MDTALAVYIGYDGREHDAYEVCRSSMLRHASNPVHVQRLSEPALRHCGLYRREWTQEGAQRIDDRDKMPFSTAFSFTRFLVPALMQHEGWAIFVDCDFMYFADITTVQRQFDSRYAVMCCKQVYKPTTDIKMDGQAQQAYNRKNWSSFMAFNCGHPANHRLTPWVVNMQKGSWLHGFGWIDRDDLIGDLDHRWNWIAGTTEGEPLAVHYTLGVPSMKGHEEQPYADEWRAELHRLGA
jgi:hypothetical protein